MNKMFGYADKKDKVTFSGIEYVCELFKTPIPFEEYQVSSISDMFKMSTAMNDTFFELFLPKSDMVDVNFNGVSEKIPSNDFVDWQLLKVSSETIYYLINKCDADFEEFYDFDDELKKDEDYNPQEWLSEYDSEFKAKGLKFIDRMRNEETDKFLNILRGCILDDDVGLKSWLETEVFPSTFEDDFEKYAEWDVMLMVVSKGDFYPYLEDTPHNLCMDDGAPNRMFIRNYDEGDI